MELIFYLMETDNKGTMKIIFEDSALEKTKLSDLIREGLGKVYFGLL